MMALGHLPPLAVIPTAAVPLLFALHLTSVPALLKARRIAPLATAPRTAKPPTRSRTSGEG